MEPAPGYRRYLSVFTPSGTGGVGYAVITGLIFLIENLHALQRALYGSEELQAQSDFWHRINEHIIKFLGFSGGNALALYLFWAAVGIVVYVILHFSFSKLGELGDDINLRHYIWPNKQLRNRPLRHFFEQGVFRLAMFAVTFVYIKYLLGFMFRPIESSWPNSTWLNDHSPVKYVLVFAVDVVLLHILVVLLRLLLLRKRLFSSVE